MASSAARPINGSRLSSAIPLPSRWRFPKAARETTRLTTRLPTVAPQIAWTVARHHRPRLVTNVLYSPATAPWWKLLSAARLHRMLDAAPATARCFRPESWRNPWQLLRVSQHWKRRYQPGVCVFRARLRRLHAGRIRSRRREKCPDVGGRERSN
jgi:hypothetical protein